MPIRKYPSIIDKTQLAKEINLTDGFFGVADFDNFMVDSSMQETSTSILVGKILTTTSGRVEKSSAYKDVNYTVLATDHIIKYEATSLRRVALPVPTGNSGQVFTFVNKYSATAAIDFSRSIDGSAAGVLTLSAGNAITIQSDGTEYIIIR